MKLLLVLSVLAAAALAESVQLSINREAFLCQCTPGQEQHQEMMDALDWCRQNKPVYEGTKNLFGRGGRQQDEKYCILWKLGFVKNSGKNIDFDKLEAYLEPMISGLDMQEDYDICQATAEQTSLDSDSGFWDSISDFVVGENYKFSLVSKRVEVLEDCLLAAREQRCVPYVIDQYFGNC